MTWVINQGKHFFFVFPYRRNPVIDPCQVLSKHFSERVLRVVNMFNADLPPSSKLMPRSAQVAEMIGKPADVNNCCGRWIFKSWNTAKRRPKFINDALWNLKAGLVGHSCFKNHFVKASCSLQQRKADLKAPINFKFSLLSSNFERFFMLIFGNFERSPYCCNCTNGLKPSSDGTCVVQDAAIFPKPAKHTIFNVHFHLRGLNV